MNASPLKQAVNDFLDRLHTKNGLRPDELHHKFLACLTVVSHDSQTVHISDVSLGEKLGLFGL